MKRLIISFVCFLCGKRIIGGKWTLIKLKVSDGYCRVCFEKSDEERKLIEKSWIEIERRRKMKKAKMEELQREIQIMEQEVSIKVCDWNTINYRLQIRRLEDDYNYFRDFLLLTTKDNPEVHNHVFAVISFFNDKKQEAVRGIDELVNKNLLLKNKHLEYLELLKKGEGK